VASSAGKNDSTRSEKKDRALLELEVLPTRSRITRILEHEPVEVEQARHRSEGSVGDVCAPLPRASTRVLAELHPGITQEVIPDEAQSRSRNAR
jgi:hypothetical protein